MLVALGDHRTPTVSVFPQVFLIELLCQPSLAQRGPDIGHHALEWSVVHRAIVHEVDQPVVQEVGIQTSVDRPVGISSSREVGPRNFQAILSSSIRVRSPKAVGVISSLSVADSISIVCVRGSAAIETKVTSASAGWHLIAGWLTPCRS